MKANKLLFDEKVLDEFLDREPPHLAMIRSIEAVFYHNYLPLKGKVLDVGCGDGFFSWSVFNQQKIDTGIDIEGSLWTEAKNRGNYRAVKVFDGKKIPFPDSSFETVICNCVLEHVESSQLLINEMARVLKKDGNLLLTVVTDTFGDKLLGTWIVGADYKRWFNKKSVHVANVAPSVWKAQLEKAGLNIIESETYFNSDKVMRFFDITHYWGIINLMTRKFAGKWVVGPSKAGNRIWERIFTKMAENCVANKDRPYLFIAASR